MNAAVQLLLVSIISPTVLLVLTWYFRRNEKRADWDREDVVAKKALEASLAMTDAVERQTVSIEEAAAVTGEKLVEIHDLVNSNLTASMQSERGEAEAALVLMEEMIVLHRAGGREPSVVTLAAVETKKAKIAELDVVLRDRLDQTAAAAAKEANP